MWRIVVAVYGMAPATPQDKLASFADMAELIVAFLGVAAALVTYVLSSRENRNAQRRQHTFTMLLETRLSSEFRETITRRRAVFPEFMDPTFDV